MREWLMLVASEPCGSGRAIRCLSLTHEETVSLHLQVQAPEDHQGQRNPARENERRTSRKTGSLVLLSFAMGTDRDQDICQSTDRETGVCGLRAHGSGRSTRADRNRSIDRPDAL